MKPARDSSDVDFSTIGLRAWSGILKPMARAHLHHELEINYVLQGRLTYLISGQTVTLPARRFCAVWGAVPHQAIRPGGLPELIWVTLPFSTVLTWKLPESLIGRLLREGIVMERDEQPDDPLLLRRWIADLQPARNGDAPRATVLEMEARLWRMASRLQPRQTPSGRAKKMRDKPQSLLPATVERLARFLATQYREHVAMSDVARHAHVHPHYAMKLFRSHTGMTLHQYLTLQRIAHAQRLLITTERTILDIALDSGFQSVSRFYEAFTRQLGVSPRGYRLQLTPRGSVSAFSKKRK
jgi:AraC-like DNA-binding protein